MIFAIFSSRDEEAAGAFLHSPAVLRLPHLLPISASNERTWRMIRCANWNCRNRKNVAAGSDPTADRRLVRRAAPRSERKEPRRVGCRCATRRSWRLFYSSGLRLSELASLNVADVDIYTESVRVLGKGRKERVCPVGAPALEAISRYRAPRTCQTGPLSLTNSGAEFRPLDLADLETLSASHIDSRFDQSAQTTAQFCHSHARWRRRSAQRAGAC